MDDPRTNLERRLNTIMTAALEEFFRTSALFPESLLDFRDYLFEELFRATDSSYEKLYQANKEIQSTAFPYRAQDFALAIELITEYLTPERRAARHNRENHAMQRFINPPAPIVQHEPEPEGIKNPKGWAIVDERRSNAV